MAIDYWEAIHADEEGPYSVALDLIYFASTTEEFFEDVRGLWAPCMQHLEDDVAQWIIGDIIVRLQHDIARGALGTRKMLSAWDVTRISMPLGGGLVECRQMLEPLLGDDRIHLYIQEDALDCLIELEDGTRMVTDNLLSVLRQVAMVKAGEEPVSG
jgi:hypothetical protein